MKYLLLIPAILFSACGGSSSYPVPEPTELAPTSTPSLVPSPTPSCTSTTLSTEELDAINDLNVLAKNDKKKVMSEKDKESLKVLLNYFEKTQ